MEAEMVKNEPVAITGVVLSAGPGQLPTNYVSGLCFWDNCNCGKDCSLCCYATCCPYCAYADVMANIDEPTCCCPVGFGYSLACVMPLGCASWIIQTGMNIIGFGICAPFVNLVPCITCTSREALGKKYGLPTGECCCSCCAHYCCQGCAIYQESVYVKHVLKQEPTCCCYDCCCQKLCGAKAPGDFVFAPQGAPHAPDACFDAVAGVMPFMTRQAADDEEREDAVTEQPL